MASMTFDLQWKESMVELLDQLELWDPESSDLAREQLAAADESERFQQYATLYIRYLQIFRRLNESYDQTVHPQKRMDIKKTLEAVMGRVIEVKETLISLRQGVNFINLDDVLVDMKLSPDALEVPVPKFFIEDQASLLEEREKYLDVMLKEAGIAPKPAAGAALDSMTLESAIRVVQLNERGRQGRQRAKFMKEIRSNEEREKRMLASGEDSAEPEKVRPRTPPTAADRRLPLPTTANRCRPPPTTAGRWLPLPTAANRCRPLPTAADRYRCRPLPPSPHERGRRCHWVWMHVSGYATVFFLKSVCTHVHLQAALLAQRCWRGYVSRKATEEMRAEELIFIGMHARERFEPEDV